MYISDITIQGYRLFKEKISVPLNKGLTLLVGHNGCGKSTVVDALRVLVQEDEFARGVMRSDFHRPFNKPAKAAGADTIRIDCTLADLNDDDQTAYLPWLDANDQSKAYLHLEASNVEDYRGRIRRVLWGGSSRRGVFETELLDRIVCSYLPPLRDAEAKLDAYRGSRLARLVKKLCDTSKQQSLENEVRRQGDELVKQPIIIEANSLIRASIVDSIGQVLGQDALIQFSEVSFDRIVERLRLLFYPGLTGSADGGTTLTDKEYFRELSENSLGYNNLLYLATILAEMKAMKVQDASLRLLLIEEPEAHLHPQFQTRVLQYLGRAASSDGIQVVVTSHSPTIAAAAGLDMITVMSNTPYKGLSMTVVPINKCGLDSESKFFVERWLDVTKSTLLFARGVILVEGIAESLLMPELARRVLRDHGKTTLEDHGVSVINIGGVFFNHFMQLFAGQDLAGRSGDLAYVPIRCAGLTDCDPDKGEAPYPGHEAVSRNPQYKLISRLASNPNCRLFGNLKTFEYDLALEGANLNVMLEVYLGMLETDGPRRRDGEAFARIEWAVASFERKTNAAMWLLEHIESEKGRFSQRLAIHIEQNPNAQFSVPEYIQNAVLWAAAVGESPSGPRPEEVK